MDRNEKAWICNTGFAIPSSASGKAVSCPQMDFGSEGVDGRPRFLRGLQKKLDPQFVKELETDTHHPELLRDRRCRLVVFGIEFGG